MTELAAIGVNIFDAFETDVDAEENGKWFEDILGDGSGLDIKVRHIGAQVAVKNLQRLMQANRKHMVKGKLPKAVDERVLVEHLAETILLDWRGVIGKDGEPIPYNKDSAVLILTKLPKFRQTVVTLSQNMDSFRVEAKEEIAGN